MNTYLTKNEAASLIHMSVRQLDRNIAAGNIRAFKPGKMVLVHHQDVMTFIESKPLQNNPFKKWR